MLHKKAVLTKENIKGNILDKKSVLTREKIKIICFTEKLFLNSYEPFNDQFPSHIETS